MFYLREIIRDIPDLFNTTFYLARWWRAYNGDLDRIKRNMKDLFDHRRTFAYDRLETHLLQTKLEIPKMTFEVYLIFCKKKISIFKLSLFSFFVVSNIGSIASSVPHFHIYFVVSFEILTKFVLFIFLNFLNS